MELVEKIKNLVKKVINKFAGKKATKEEIEIEVIREAEKENLFFENVSEEVKDLATKSANRSKNTRYRNVKNCSKEIEDLKEDMEKSQDDNDKVKMSAKIEKKEEQLKLLQAKADVPTETLIHKMIIRYAIADLNQIIKEESLVTKSQKRHIRKVVYPNKLAKYTEEYATCLREIERHTNLINSGELHDVSIEFHEKEIEKLKRRAKKIAPYVENREALEAYLFKLAGNRNLRVNKKLYSEEMNNLKTLEKKINDEENNFIKPRPAQCREDGSIGLTIIE